MAVMLNLTYSWGAVDTSLLIRAQDLRALALRNVLFGILTAMLQLLFALLVPAAILLAVAVTLGRVAAVTLTRSAGASDDLPGVRTETQYGWRRSLLAVTSALSGSAAAQGLPLFLGASQGLQQVGYAAVAQRLSTVPATQLAQAFTQLIQIEASRSINKGEERLASALRRPLAVTATFAALAGLGVGAVGPFVVTPLLGPGWEAVAELLPALGILTAAQLLAGAFSPVLAMLGREAWLVGINVGRLLLSIGGATVVSWSTGDLTSVVAGYVVGATIAYVIHMLVVLLGIRRFDSSRPAD